RDLGGAARGRPPSPGGPRRLATTAPGRRRGHRRAAAPRSGRPAGHRRPDPRRRWRPRPARAHTAGAGAGPPGPRRPAPRRPGRGPRRARLRALDPASRDLAVLRFDDGRRRRPSGCPALHGGPLVTTLLALFRRPDGGDEALAHFERRYAAEHLPLVAATPGLRATRVQRVTASLTGESEFVVATEMEFDATRALESRRVSEPIA